MISNFLKAALIAGAVLLSACSSVSTNHGYSADSVVPSGFGPGLTNSNPDRMNVRGSALGNSYSEYGSALLHDD